jgi:hypothetical protein
MDLVLRNLLKYPPVEGSREAHEAWKQSVRCLLDCNGSDEFWNHLYRPGFVTKTCANLALQHLEEHLI